MSGQVPAASQEDVTGVIATMNLGAGEEDAFRGPKDTAFGVKLHEDMKWIVANGSDIIILQEVSEHWTNFLKEKFLPEGWCTFRAPDAKLTTFYNQQRVPFSEGAIMHVWPEQDKGNVYRGWRMFSAVRRASRPPPAPGPSPVPATFPWPRPGPGLRRAGGTCQQCGPGVGKGKWREPGPGPWPVGAGH